MNNKQNDNIRVMTPEMVHRAGENAVQSGDTLSLIMTANQQALSMQKPRDMSRIERDIIDEAARMGEDFYYRWEQYSKELKRKVPLMGVSYHGTMGMLRIYRNCNVSVVKVEAHSDAYILHGVAIDFESNFVTSRPYRIDKAFPVDGNYHDARAADIRFQIGTSKCMRNVGLALIPKYIVDKALERAYEQQVVKINNRIKNEGKENVLKSLVRKLSGYNVSELQVLHKFDRKSLLSLTVEDIAVIAGDVASLDAQTIGVEDVYPKVTVDSSEIGSRLNNQANGIKNGKKKNKSLSKSKIKWIENYVYGKISDEKVNPSIVDVINDFNANNRYRISLENETAKKEIQEIINAAHTQEKPSGKKEKKSKEVKENITPEKSEIGLLDKFRNMSEGERILKYADFNGRVDFTFKEVCEKALVEKINENDNFKSIGKEGQSRVLFYIQTRLINSN